MLIAARTRVTGLLETPRRSKIAWLREWIYFLEALIADETWLASYGQLQLRLNTSEGVQAFGMQH